MPKLRYGDKISQSEARAIRYHLVTNLHVDLPANWSAWNKTADQIADAVERFSYKEISLSPDEIELIAGRVMPQ